MSASEQEQGGGGQPTPLQPVSTRAKNLPVPHGVAAPVYMPVSAAEVTEGMPAGDDAKELAAAHERLVRRLADKDLLDRLRRSGFEGSEYDVLEEDLAAYATPVMKGWLFSGFIFPAVAKRGRPLSPTALELQELRENPELRGDLASMTIARTLPFFRRRALLGGEWDLDGGANLTTYFTGACLLVFPNEYRRHRTADQRWSPNRLQGDAFLDTATHASSDPGSIVAGLDWVTTTLDGIKNASWKAAAALTLDGYTQAEIAEMLGLTSDRAVEGLMYRFRNDYKKGGTP